MNPYTNLTEALEGLMCQGYTMSFVAKKDFLNARNHNLKMNYNEIEVEYAYHFSDPDPRVNAFIYGVSSKDHIIKGLIIVNDSMLLENEVSREKKQI
ncbi:hypothetical protein [Flavobacterium sp. LHD-85]|uniref:hypothetical protein n=1 Tax=Flavobacterium sp. LHD-85 TaxID=3071410 RepID=UPI0027E0CFB9|nr:hypothetical protein [Flavobacterium sp. LHD-85]MDQ6532145.1 hypothetical protein [Flavobacterium sp. LHD-85]